MAAWRSNNKDKIKESSKKYYEKNKVLKGRKKVDRKTRLAEKYKTDIKFKLSTNLRNRLNIAIKNKYKSGSAVSDLGCSIKEFIVHLESKFLLGMTWENYSRDGWHIDHIIPLSHFDLTNREQLLEACHYTNLQPLWAKDNIKKGAK